MFSRCGPAPQNFGDEFDDSSDGENGKQTCANVEFGFWMGA